MDLRKKKLSNIYSIFTHAVHLFLLRLFNVFFNVLMTVLFIMLLFVFQLVAFFIKLFPYNVFSHIST